MYLVVLILVGAVLFALGSVLFGRGEQLPPLPHATTATVLPASGVTGADVEERALVAGLAVNKNAVPNDPRPPMVTSGLRLGTPAVTTRGFGEAEIEAAADIVVGLVRGEDPQSYRSRVQELCEAHPVP